MRLKIASRKSDLARIQSHEVAAALKKIHPDLEVEFHFSESLGDKNLTDPLWKMPEKGVFTSDLTEDLVQGRADLIVHSWKDLPTEENAQTEIVCTLPRADVRDLLLFKKSSRAKLADAKPIKIFSSSPRREYNLRPFLKDALPFHPQDLSFESVRGNVPTRLRKLLESDADGFIVAKAAIDRILGTTADEFGEAREQVKLALSKCDYMVLPLSKNPAAAAQGALAIEIRRDRADLRALLEGIHQPEPFIEAIKEREILRSYGGGCHQKIGITILHRDGKQLKFLKGLTDAGVELRECSWEGTSAIASDPVGSDLLFERKQRSGPHSAGSATALFISHAAAWPEGFSFEGILWTAGLTTWKKMAGQGQWINGSCEGLGEKEDPRLQRISGDLQWATLSHGAAPSGERGPVIPTYDLLPKADAHPPQGFALHWTSGHVFEEALRRWPELKNRRHSCGPGKTADAVRKHIPNVEIRWPGKENR